MASGSLGLASHVYRYGDRLVASELELPELPRNDRDPRGELVEEPNCVVCTNGGPAGAVSWVHDWRSREGQLTASLARHDSGYLLRFPGLLDFRISTDARRVSWSRPESVSLETLRHLLLDQVLPRVVAQAGRLVLHASAVRVGNQSLVFVGETGQGKSCLAASFHAAGHSLLSDDGVIVFPHEDGLRILPTYPSLRLWPAAIREFFSELPRLEPMAHYSLKVRVELAAGETAAWTPLPLAGIFVLRPASGPADPPWVASLTARDGCVELLRHTFQLDPTDRQRARILFSTVGELACRVPVFAIAYPRQYACLPEVRAEILERAFPHNVRTGNSSRRRG